MFNREQIFSLAWWTVSIGSSLPRVGPLSRAEFSKTGVWNENGDAGSIVSNIFPPGFLAESGVYIARYDR